MAGLLKKLKNPYHGVPRAAADSCCPSNVVIKHLGVMKTSVFGGELGAPILVGGLLLSTISLTYRPTCFCFTGICFLPADPGVCLAYNPMFYFNSAIGKCERFIYGGCRGNANRFFTYAACAAKCHG